MNTALWIMAGLLACTFAVSGAMKLFRSREALAASGMGVLADLGPGTVKAIGALEVMAAAGLILPGALGLVPVLVPMAAVVVAWGRFGPHSFTG